jgi:membrane protein DedA with SNARE-associated domain
MMLAEEPVFVWMSQFAYEPSMVYAALVIMMVLSSVGFPIPEEVTLLSVGLLAYFGAHPELFPPPYLGAHPVNTQVAMVIASVAVLGSDFLVFFIGHRFGRSILKKPALNRFFPERVQNRIEDWTHRYGAYTCAVFRFTPGLRFPGHLAYGMMKFPTWKFLVIDGIAVVVSVPTQIYLMATFGETVLLHLKQFKLVIFAVLALVVLFFIGKKLWKKIRLKKAKI